MIRVLLLVGCCFIFGSVEAQKVDTIWVSYGKKTMVFMPSKITLVDPSISKYGFKVKNNRVGLTAKVRDTPSALLMIGYDTVVWYGTIAYKKELTPKDQVVNLQRLKKENIANTSRIKRQDSLLSSRQQMVLVNLKALKDEYGDVDEQKMIGVMKGKLEFKLSVMRKDDSYYYFKLYITNSSKDEKYMVDFVNFTFYDKAENKSLGKPKSYQALPEQKLGGPNLGDNKRKYYVPMKVGKTEGKAVLYYAIKKFVVSKKGWLEVRVKEEFGGRNMIFKIYNKDLIKIKEF